LAGVKYGCRGRPPTLFYRLVQGLVSLSEFFSASRSQLLQAQGLGEKVAGEIKSFDVDSVTECELRLADKEGVRTLTLLKLTMILLQ
jgi:ERCC4-type nuclease